MNRRQMLAGIVTGLTVLGAAGSAMAQRPGQADPSVLIDVNSAPPEKLMTLNNIDLMTAKKIIAARPYKAKNDLVNKKVLTPEQFKGIETRITVPAPEPAAKKK